jgi:phage anti-repressor protein
MNELIRIGSRQIGGEGVQTVDARDLHRFLQVGRDFTNWIKDRIQAYGFIDGQDYEVVAKSGENPFGGRPTMEYAVSLDMAKELAMVERNEKGREARRYFIECERQAKQGAHTPVRPGLRSVASEFRGALAIAKLAGFKGNQAILSGAKAIELVMGVNPLDLVGATHLIADEPVRHCTPTELGATLGESAQAFNKRLERAGVQEKGIAGTWVATDAGRPYAVLLDTGKQHSDGTPVQQLRWLESVLELFPRHDVA